ncbi:non-hydrolyzing UDP-N-acetylglucosamine 2-epimerase [Candidatus Chloroploca asiatica]|uniref:UDP-N-acetylglucosamine 2-epimerase n=1 Tax=Candidatus Chloroploca asiatica TaxID=1506545 RepID=A0A2H3L0X1_9CHLR|nr:UDP-N-acetylglucosamine 2-epimerase (non-hydrolyzing) [Candidatus Chloroploca asiatica]PDV99976.1 UDP-N-acetylglucosamine 2-epimerase [Candidatus Chloroploca asiatica]
MRVLTIVGARPQFIKSAPVTRALRNGGYEEFLVHTGQHYDYGMSQVFFEQLHLPRPSINLDIGSGSHGYQTGQMLIEIEKVILAQRPDCVLVYGDTNSTLAGALAAAKLHVPVAHVEAGLRSFNRQMPEEHNRVLTDHLSDILFCPTKTAVDNLLQEAIAKNVHQVGDTMYDAVMQFSDTARAKSDILSTLKIKPQDYILATIHRPYNTDDPSVLSSIWQALCAIDQTVIFPVHPRTRRKLEMMDLHVHLAGASLRIIEPVGYLDMLVLEQNARMVLTDSGGVQKEAFFFAVPCITLRPETEWVETVESGWNILTRPDAILQAVSDHAWPITPPPPIFGDGNSAAKIVNILTKVE